MAIAIYDYDLLHLKKEFVPNLEAMKLSAYCKQKGIPVFLIDNIEEYFKYEQCYIFKRLPNKIVHPEIWSQDKVICSGSGFSKVYIPLAKEIEEQYPDITIYSKVLRDKFFTGEKTSGSLRNIIEKTNYLRIKSGDLFYDLNKLSPERKLIIYDQQFESSEEFKQHLYEAYAKSTYKIHLLYPVEAKTKEEFFLYSSPLLDRDSKIILFGNMNYVQYRTFADEVKDKGIKRMPIFQFGIDPTGQYTEDFFCREIISTLNKCFYARSIGLFPEIESVNNTINQTYYPVLRKLGDFINLRMCSSDFLEYSKTITVVKKIIQNPRYGKALTSLFRVKINNVKEGGWVYCGS